MKIEIIKKNGSFWVVADTPSGLCHDVFNTRVEARVFILKFYGRNVQ